MNVLSIGMFSPFDKSRVLPLYPLNCSLRYSYGCYASPCHGSPYPIPHLLHNECDE